MLFRIVLELALIVAFVVGARHWPAADGTREVRITARME